MNPASKEGGETFGNPLSRFLMESVREIPDLAQSGRLSLPFLFGDASMDGPMPRYHPEFVMVG